MTYNHEFVPFDLILIFFILAGNFLKLVAIKELIRSIAIDFIRPCGKVNHLMLTLVVLFVANAFSRFSRFMYQSIPSLTIPPGKSPGNFFKERIPHSRAQRKCETPTWGNYFQKSSKKQNMRQTMKNSTETLICLEILKQ